MADEAEVAEVETPAEAPVSDPGGFEPEIKKDQAVDESPAAPEQEADAGEQEAEAADEPAKIDPRLLEKAAQYGWNEDDLKGIDLDKLERMILRAEVARLTPPPEKKAEPQKQEFKLEFPEEFDPAAKDVIEKLSGYYGQQVQALTEQLASISQYVHNQQIEALDGRLSDMFSGLEDDHKEVFGAGKMSDVRGTPEGEKRKEVLRMMDVLERGYATRGEKVPNERDLFQHAIKIVSPVDAKKAARKELSEKITAAKKTQFLRPKNRSKNEAPLGYDKAVQSVAAILEKHRETEAPEKFQ